MSTSNKRCGSTLRVVVTATNAAGAVSVASAATAPIAGVAPSATAAPEISGTATDGETLSAWAGTWDGSTPRTYTRRWQRCDAGGDACVDIVGATDDTYTLTGADVGATIRVVVTAANIGRHRVGDQRRDRGRRPGGAGQHR